MRCDRLSEFGKSAREFVFHRLIGLDTAVDAAVPSWLI
jgi:hypothetical protein